MNNILQLKGTLDSRSAPQGGGAVNLPNGKHVSSDHLRKLLGELETLRSSWLREDKYFTGVLVQAQYRDVVAKSRRLSAIFSTSKVSANDTIVGAKFSKGDKPKHIITHYVDMVLLEKAISMFKISIWALDNIFNSTLSYNDIVQINKEKSLTLDGISRSKFVQLVIDSYYIESFYLEVNDDEFASDALVTIYDTNTDTRKLLESIGIKIFPTRIIDNTTLFLDPDQIAILKSKAPYLIAMGVRDLSQLTKSDIDTIGDCAITIPSPKNEPVIGVIDTLFDENVYFSDWVEFHNMVDPSFDINPEDYEHGTAVSSIIVDGVASNPHLDDGCGRFRVRHFGVAVNGRFSSFTIMKNIEEIVRQHKDIKVWNLSLGSMKEIHPSFISPEAAFLDKLQHENDITFVVAGTNLSTGESDKYIGSPADSINSIVVNAVDSEMNKASYSRRGPVLSFFTKPDVAYFGGDKKDRIRVCTPTGEAFVCGTSFAAPWIARKLAYMINILGINREVAKALLIHSALDWEGNSEQDSIYQGYGIVPVHINNIVKSADNEIRFVISGASEEHTTYTYRLPVPKKDDKYPYIAKATMCYFPACSRNQGVDYTNTEFEFSFGRIDDKGKIKPIAKKANNNSSSHLYEGNARELYRKWDNVKNLLEVDTGRKRPVSVYDRKQWGLSVRSLERLSIKHGKGLNFGVVITLKELFGKNRIADFKQLCQAQGWLVNEIDIQSRIDIHNLAEEEVKFED